MEMVVAVGRAEDAPGLIDVEAAHIDGCLYHGVAGLDFARALASAGGRVVVPTTLNVSSLDLLHPDLYRGDPGTAANARDLMEAYVAMGCRPTWTCAPYQLPERPSLGLQIAWGESNAIVFANSVLGARTNRYGDFMDICCALTGRAPYTGLHTDAGRRATMVIELDLPEDALDSDLTYPLLGHALGRVAGTEVAAIVGLDARAGEDRLKAIGAAAASSGAVAMFHAVGVTPEAPNLGAATQGGSVAPRLTFDEQTLWSARRELTSAVGSLGAVSVGTPHMSISEMARLAVLVDGLTTKVPFYLNTSRDTLGTVDPSALSVIEEFGATVVTDTCTYVTAIMGELKGDLLTDSGKLAYYAPANMGARVAIATLEDCVTSAATGETVLTDLWVRR